MSERPEMDEQLQKHLSQISTTWTALFKAHDASGAGVSEAQRRVLERYSAAVYRYLLGALRDRDAADGLFQDFALRLVRGDFKKAHPERGRFRQFLKTALYHLVIDYRRRRQAPTVPLADADAQEAVEANSATDSEFQTLWRDEVMTRAWDALADWEKQTGQPLCTVLHCRTTHADMDSTQLAQEVSRILGEAVSINWLRKRLHFAREKFKDLLINEVAGALDAPDPAILAEELAELGLLEYCQGALERWHNRSRA